MWEFPHAELLDDEAAEEAAKRVVTELTGLRVVVGSEVLTVRHTVTRFAITLYCFEAQHTSGAFESAFYTEGRWVSLRKLAEYPVSSPQRRLIAELTRDGRQRRLC